jgi:cbb3-type cytochrome oxidase subunit 3
MDWRQWLYIIYTGVLVLILYLFVYYLYSKKSRSDEIEKSGQILFTDEPVEPHSKDEKPNHKEKEKC